MKQATRASRNLLGPMQCCHDRGDCAVLQLTIIRVAAASGNSVDAVLARAADDLLHLADVGRIHHSRAARQGHGNPGVGAISQTHITRRPSTWSCVIGRVSTTEQVTHGAKLSTCCQKHPALACTSSTCRKDPDTLSDQDHSLWQAFCLCTKWTPLWHCTAPSRSLVLSFFSA